MTDLAELERQAGDPTVLPAWQALASHAMTLRGIHLRDLLDQAGRYESLSRESGGFLLDFSRQALIPETLALLLQLAADRQVPAWIEALFTGAPVNNTEDRPALHVALRMEPGQSLPLADGTDAVALATAERERMLAVAEQVRAGGWLGATGRPVRHVVNIGIGGSDLGLVMAVEALGPWVSHALHFHFVSNVDGTQLADVLAAVPAEETLFIICSKSFTTLETAINAETARRWLAARLGEGAVHRHFLAISVNEPAMDRFGIAPEHRFRLWDWVGGRYSLWSPVGLAIAMAIGAENFRALLRGARRMDGHFRGAPLGENLPVLLALVGIWNINFRGLTSHAVLPYDGRLHRFPAYLQQLEMESNGKGVRRDGSPVTTATATVLWGEPGSNAQHSFFQLLHQGTAAFSADFIAPVEGSSSLLDQHRHALANMLAQAEAFARGYTAAEADGELSRRGLPPEHRRRLVPHKVHPGNHPSSLILLDRLDPECLGALVALYEHKVFVQACIWGINPFDQWGVELGKSLAGGLYAALGGEGSGAGLPGIVGAIRRRWS